MSSSHSFILLPLLYGYDSLHTHSKAIRDRGVGVKAGDILRDNHYGWFERLDRGLYGLTEKGRQALDEYRTLSGS